MTIYRIQDGFSLCFDYFLVHCVLFSQSTESVSDIFGIGFWIDRGLNDFFHLLCASF